MRSLDFSLVDVFADEPLTGNPLAVVLGGDDLPDDLLARVAREFNQSETTFVLQPRRQGVTRRLRSFTAGGAEVYGAGHNALGAWWWLVATGHEQPGSLTQELGDDVLGVEVAADAEDVTVALRQDAPTLGAEVDAQARLAFPLGLDAGALAAGPARVVSTGAAHLLVEAVSRDAVDGARPDARTLAAALSDAGAQGCYLFARDARGADTAAYTRFFNPTVGLWEDAATGSAAGPLAWWLSASDGPRRRTITIEQGHALGRPSRLVVDVDGDAVTLSGTATLTAEGRIYVPAPEAGR